MAIAGGPDPPVDLGSSKGISYVKRTLPDFDGFQAGLSVDCPSGAEATGGGASMTGRTNAIAVDESYPREVAPSPNGWQVLVTSSFGSRDVNAFVACANTDLVVASADEEHQVAESADLTVACADLGYQPTSGGVSASPAPAFGSASLAATYPPIPQPTSVGTWRGVATMTAGPGDLIFHAVCSQAFVINYRQSDPVRLESYRGGKATVSCNRSEAVLGGGVALFLNGEPQTSVGVSATRPHDSKSDGNKVPDDGWLARGHNFSTETLRLRAFAACKVGLAPE